MYKLVQWSEDLDSTLTEFYKEAERRGLVNNASRRMLVDSLSKEREWAVWILYYNDQPVGSVGAHSFDDVMGTGSYRIAVRTCAFTDKLPYPTLRTRNQIITHQHITGQFLIPCCINWAPKKSKLYITSTDSDLGTQRMVHKVFGPAMEASGQMKRIKDVHYRGTDQTVWELFPDKFLNELYKYPRWQ